MNRKRERKEKKEEIERSTATVLPGKGPNPVLRGPRFQTREYWDRGFTDEAGNIVLIPIMIASSVI